MIRDSLQNNNKQTKNENQQNKIPRCVWHIQAVEDQGIKLPPSH